VRTPPTPHRSNLFGAFAFEDIRQRPNDGRFRNEFADIEVVGKGEFATVFSAVCRTDQHPYAVKVVKPHNRDRQAILREVQALAKVAVGGCPHIVRYFSSWWEDDMLHIQTELCSGSLRGMLHFRAEAAAACQGDPQLAEGDLLVLLRHMAAGLKELHAHGLAHLDVKPENVLTIGNAETTSQVYKLADLGLVTASTRSSGDDAEEGDCRYVAHELLQQQPHLDLPKTDIFSTSLVIFEAATNPRELPRSGPEWHDLRCGRLNTIELAARLSSSFLEFLLRMASADPNSRPSSEEALVFAEESASAQGGGPTAPRVRQQLCPRCQADVP